MRIDELELRQRARVVLEFLHLKQAEAVMRERRAGCGERQRKCQPRDVSRTGANRHGRTTSAMPATIPRASAEGLESCIPGRPRSSLHFPHGGEKRMGLSTRVLIAAAALAFAVPAAQAQIDDEVAAQGSPMHGAPKPWRNVRGFGRV